jgi:hypothetical protein
VNLRRVADHCRPNELTFLLLQVRIHPLNEQKFAAGALVLEGRFILALRYDGVVFPMMLGIDVRQIGIEVRKDSDF